MAREMVPVHSMRVRESLKLRKADVAREANTQPGILTWIEAGRFIPYDSQIEKIASVYRRHGWKGATEDLLEEVS
ncbi:MAG: hypothetical protein QM302_07330 [Acidobacteriota bacterium]|nr:hypothetical protein [Acidobacteriota bacterium]